MSENEEGHSKKVQAPTTVATPEEVALDKGIATPEELALDAEVANAENRWIELGADPMGISISAPKVEAEMRTVVHFLVHLGINEKEIQMVFKKNLAECLDEMREAVTPMIIAERRKAKGLPPLLVDPSGKTLLQ